MLCVVLSVQATYAQLERIAAEDGGWMQLFPEAAPDEVLAALYGHVVEKTGVPRHQVAALGLSIRYEEGISYRFEVAAGALRLEVVVFADFENKVSVRHSAERQ